LYLGVRHGVACIADHLHRRRNAAYCYPSNATLLGKFLHLEKESFLDVPRWNVVSFIVHLHRVSIKLMTSSTLRMCEPWIEIRGQMFRKPVTAIRTANIPTACHAAG
jgi:hypothetical protein